MADFAADILVVDDDPAIRDTLRDRVQAAGHRVETLGTGEQALERVRRDEPDLMILDVHLPGADGLSILRLLRKEQHDVATIVITAYGEIETAVTAMKLGALDFLAKPFEMAHLDVAVNKALDTLGLRRENRRLHDELKRRVPPIVAESPQMKALMRMVDKLGDSRSTVLLLGESGTGKEVLARAIHARGQSARRPFVAANCAALPAQLLESELFGHEQGAFTGATRGRRGLFEVADGGTLFLDEIGDLDIALQPKLLRVLQEHAFTRVGGSRELQVDVRVIAATNKKLEEAVARGEFRKDLYYRLDVVTIEVPPLRDRPTDIACLAERFLDRYARETHSRMRTISPDAMQHLKTYRWPGNVRELENAIERAVVLAESDVLTPDDLPAAILQRKGVEPDRSTDSLVDLGFHEAVREFKRRLLSAALQRHEGVQVNAARALELHPTYLSRLIKNLSVRR